MREMENKTVRKGNAIEFVFCNPLSTDVVVASACNACGYAYNV